MWWEREFPILITEAQVLSLELCSVLFREIVFPFIFWVTPSRTQDLRGPYMVLGFKSGLTMYKARTPTAVLLLWPPQSDWFQIPESHAKSHESMRLGAKQRWVLCLTESRPHQALEFFCFVLYLISWVLTLCIELSVDDIIFYSTAFAVKPMLWILAVICYTSQFQNV